MANVTLRLVKGTPLTNQEVDNNFSNLNIFKTEIGGDLGGNVLYPTVIGIQGRSVTSDAPANTQVLVWSDTANAWTPGNAASSYADLQTKPAVNVLVTGDITGSSNVVLQNTNTNLITLNTSFNPTNFDSRYLKLSNPTTQIVSSYINFQGNVIFSGNVTTISANNLIIEDNFIYLNNASQNTNVDFGFVGNYNDDIFAHAGFFRDASDNGTWKIFDGYLPEPSEEINIDTDNASFRLANLQVQVLKANTITGISNTTVVTNLNADLLDGQQGTYYVDYTNATNRPAVNVALTGDVTGSANLVLVSGTNQITIATTIQPNSVALGTDTTGDYTQYILPGTAITVSGTAGEGNVITVNHADTSTVANVSSDNSNGVAIQDISLGFDGLGHVTSATVATTDFDTRYLGIAAKASDSDLLDGQDSTYYLNYQNLANRPASNIVLTGDITGAANAVLTGNSTVISIATTIAPNSVALGTDTTGNYVANVEAGTGIVASGGGSETSTVTISHADTSSVANVSSDNSNGVVIQDISLGFDTFGHVTSASVATANLDTRYLGLTSKAADADQLDGQDSTHYLNYSNLTNKPAANIILSGDLSGTANAVLVANSTVLSVTTTLASTGVVANTYGNATVIPVITVDAKGRITAASNVTLTPGVGTSSDTQILYNSSGAVVGSSSLTFDGTNLRSPQLVATASSGDEGGEIQLAKPASNATYTGNIVIDAFQNKLRIFEAGGTNRGVYIDLTAANAGVATNLLSSGGGGTSNYPDLTNKPAVNVTFTGDVTGAGNVLLTNGGTNSLAIALTVQPNSVALGTDTTGNYTDRVVAGNGIIATGTADEGNVITVGLTTTGVTANTYGNATIVPVITVDAQGRITSASNVAISAGGGATLDAQKNFTVVDACSLTATGCFNTFIGSGAGRCTTFGSYNFFVGQCAGFNNTTASFNFFAGRCAGVCNTTGAYNNFFGLRAGRSNTTGSRNNFFGFRAGDNNTTGSYNNFLGSTAGELNFTGSNNNFFGNCAGFSNSTGSDNNFIGRRAGNQNTTGTKNNFIGVCAGDSNTFGCHNNFFGRYAGFFNVTGSYNIFNGTCAGFNNSTGSNNIFAGSCVGFCNTTGVRNIFFGCQAGGNIATGNNNIIFGNISNNVGLTSSTSNVIIFATGGTIRFLNDGGLGNTTVTGNVIAGTFFGDGSKLTGISAGGASLDAQKNFTVVDACALTATGCHNVFIGSGAGRCTTFGKFNFFAGQCAGFESTTSCNNIFLGKFAGQCTTISSNNVFLGNYAGRRATCANNTYIGAFAGQCDTIGQCNVFLGFCSGALNSSGNDNTFLGHIAGSCNTTGSYNTFLGNCAGFLNTTGSFNTFLGHTAGSNNTTGCYNTFIGHYSGYSNTFGFYNNFLGVNTGYCNTTGQYNLFLGNTAGRTNSTGSKNVFLGHSAGFFNTTGCQNTFLGFNSGLCSTTGCNNTIIGHLAGRNIKFGSFNALFGHCAGCSITTGCNNIIIGSVAGTAGLSDTIILATGTCERIRTDGALGNTTVTGNVIASAFYGDGSKLTGLSSTYTSLPDKPSINVIFSGYVSGNANVTLVSGTNLVEITTVKEAVDFYFTNTAPVSPAIGDTWVHSETGVTYRYINDGNSTQWVDLTSYSSITGGGSTASDSLSPFLLMGA